MEENNPSTNTDNQTPNDTSSSPPAGGDVFHPESAPAGTTAGSATENNELGAQKPGVLGAEPGKTPKKKSKKGLLITLLVLVLAALGAGAWWYMQNKDETDSQASKTKQLVEIDELKVGMTEGPASVYFPDEGLLGVQTIMDHQIYEGLVGFKDKKATPLLAESWTNPDEKTWVFKIRPNVKFHTGKPVTATEIKAALEDLKKYEYWSIFVSTIDTIEATGDLELKIKTKEADALLLNRLSQAYISDITASDKAGNNGTGAYQVDTTVTNDKKSTTLIPFDEYHGERAKTRKLVFVIYESDDVLIKALKNKEIDIAETIPIPSVTDEIKGTDFASTEHVAPGAFGVYMNQIRTTTTILKNKEIRQAIALSIDRQGLIDKVGNKNVPATQVIPESLPGYDPTISFPAFDLTAAKAALAKAGYKGTPLEFVYIEELQQDAPVAIEQLRTVGFTITEKKYKADDLDTALVDLRAGKFDLFFAGFTSDVFDARDILGSLLGSTESTYPNYNDPEYDAILVESDKEFDPVKRIQLLQKANKHIVDNLAWLPVRNSNYVAYHPKDIELSSDFNGGSYIGAYYREVGRTVE